MHADRRVCAIYVSSTMRTPPHSVHGHEYRFVTVKQTDFFGLMPVWVTKQQSVMVSDKERTIRRLSQVKQPIQSGVETSMNSAGVSGMFSDHDDEVREVLRERPLMGELPYVFLDGLWQKRLIGGPADIARQVSIRGRYRN